jgi:hypothetical protein
VILCFPLSEINQPTEIVSESARFRLCDLTSCGSTHIIKHICFSIGSEAKVQVDRHRVHTNQRRRVTFCRGAAPCTSWARWSCGAPQPTASAPKTSTWPAAMGRRTGFSRTMPIFQPGTSARGIMSRPKCSTSLDTG